MTVLSATIGALLAAAVLGLLGFRLPVRLGLAALVFALVAVAVPMLARQTRDKAEAAVLYNLALVVAKEDQFREAKVLDADEDGLGEFGTLGELYRTRPPLISPDLAGQQQHGYWYQVHLDEAIDDRETTFYVIAIPQFYGVTGRRSFVADRSGTIRAKDAGDRRREPLYPQHAEDWPVVPTPHLR